MIFNSLIQLAMSAYLFLINLLPNASAQDYLNTQNMLDLIPRVHQTISTALFWFPIWDLEMIAFLIVEIELWITFVIIARYLIHIITVGLVK
jgi:hypothetical protein